MLLTMMTQARYPALKSQVPNDGRRMLLLRVADEFWKSLESGSLVENIASPVSVTQYPFIWIRVVILAQDDPNLDRMDGDDPCDAITEGPELGILVRTDYSDEGAWQESYSRLQECEKEFAKEIEMGENDAPQSNTEDVEMEEDSEGDSDDEPSTILHVLNPISVPERNMFTDISNLAALRLLNDVDIRPIANPAGKRISPPHRLIDYGGWQEIYDGKSIWIYDTKSNTDRSVRVVSQQGDFYGTAT